MTVNPVPSAALSNDFQAAIDRLLVRIKAHEATVGIIGLGYVGLPLALAFGSRGFSVIGFDIDQSKVDALNSGRSYIRHIQSTEIERLTTAKRLHATSDYGHLAATDIILLCVPTPLTRNREPDLSFIVKTAEALVPHLRVGQLIVLESTSYPGTTRELLVPILERSGLRSGENLFVAYSPEREDPGNEKYDTGSIPKVVGGDGAVALQLAQALYQQIVSSTVAVSSPETAEAVKLTENIFRSINIALVNELKIVFSAMGIDIWEVIDAAKTKPFGFMPFYPGPGLGGHCIPIDPFYLTWKAREYDITPRFIELAGELNTAMPRYVVARLAEALNQRFARGLNGTRILVVGLAYKKNVDDARESPAFKIMELIENQGAIIDYFDPYISTIPPTREHRQYAGKRSIAFTASILATYSAAIIVTDHDDVDYASLVGACPLVVDTRNATRLVAQNRDRIVKA